MSTVRMAADSRLRDIRAIALRNVWSKTLRDYRVPILIWGIGLGLAVVVTFASFQAMSPATRAAEAQYAGTFRFLAEPVAVTTAVGYVTWHTIGMLPVMLAIWTALAGARLVRGDEERGEMDILLSEPQSRARLIGERIAAFVTALFLIALLMTLVVTVGGPATGVSIDMGRVLLMSLNVTLTALVFGLIAAALAHLLRHRAAAAGITGALVALAYLINSTGRILRDGEWLRRFSPLYYHDLSQPLIPSYGTNIGALCLLAATSLLLAGASMYMFTQRDIGGVAFPTVALRGRFPHARRAGSSIARARRDVSLRTPGLRALRSQRASIVWWMVGLLGYTAWVTMIARSAKDTLTKMLTSTPAFAQLFRAFDLTSDTGFLAAIVFVYLPVICVLFAMLQAMPWASDREGGRVELQLATPLSRRRLYVERFATVTLACLVAPLVSAIGVIAAAQIADLSLDAGRILVALVGLLPIELLTGAAVYLLSGWLGARSVAAVVGTVIGVSYFAEFLNPILKLPNWLISLSIFHQYGAPLTGSPNWMGWLAVLFVAGACFVWGIHRFMDRDIVGQS